MRPCLSIAIIIALSQTAILISANPLHRPFSAPLENQGIDVEKDVVLSTRTPHPFLQPRNPPGIRWENSHVKTGAVIFVVPGYRSLTDAISGMLVEAYAILNDGIHVLGDDAILDHFTWLGRDGLMLLVHVEKGQELLKSVMRDAVTELYDFMTRVGWMTASFTVMQGKKQVGIGRLGLL